MRVEDRLPVDLLRQCVELCEGGRLYYRHRDRSTFASDHGYRAHLARGAGKPADNTFAYSGHRKVHLYVHGRRHTLMAHRVVWALMHGRWPAAFIDHIDGDPANNEPTNLRDVSHSVNMQNRRRALASNRQGLLGVSRHVNGATYVARIKVRGVEHRRAGFASAEDAHVAYLEMKRQLHPGCMG